MEFKLLKTFVEVERTGSFSKAAETLSYAQSSVSDQIRKLEGELGTTLFERIGNSIRLTKDGQMLLVYAKKILNLCDEAVSNLSSSEIRGEIRVALPETFCVYILPELMRDYHRLYPQVQIKIKMGNCHDFGIWLKKNIVDVAFVFDDMSGDDEIVSEFLFDEKLVLVANENHRLSRIGRCKSEDFTGENLIMTDGVSRYRALFEEYLKLKGISPGSVFEFESIEAMKQFARNGFGVAFLPSSTVQSDIESGTLVEIELDGREVSIPALLIYHRDKWISPALRAFMDLSYRLKK